MYGRVGCVVATAFISLAPAMAGGQVAGGPGLLRTPDGRPDMSGIWQVMNGAAWNIQDQNAAPARAAHLAGRSRESRRRRGQ